MPKQVHLKSLQFTKNEILEKIQKMIQNILISSIALLAAAASKLFYPNYWLLIILFSITVVVMYLCIQIFLLFKKHKKIREKICRLNRELNQT